MWSVEEAECSDRRSGVFGLVVVHGALFFEDRAVALLELLARAAGAQIVASDLGRGRRRATGLYRQRRGFRSGIGLPGVTGDRGFELGAMPSLGLGFDGGQLFLTG